VEDVSTPQEVVVELRPEQFGRRHQPLERQDAARGVE
jgi:hypothetical protein